MKKILYLYIAVMLLAGLSVVVQAVARNTQAKPVASKTVTETDNTAVNATPDNTPVLTPSNESNGTEEQAAAPKGFSISSTQQVYFAKGNLQKVGNSWQFAEHQYDYFGENQTSDHRDMFSFNDSYPYTCPDGWYCLSIEQWDYILTQRSVSNTLSNGARYTLVTLNLGNSIVKGMIIFPDNYTHPSGTGFVAGTFNGASNYTATVGLEGWVLMEKAGCVFLPAAGYKSSGTTWFGVNDEGSYMSTTPYPTGSYYDTYFTPNNIDVNDYSNLNTWSSVRLVSNNPPDDEAGLTRSGQAAAYDGTRADFLTVAGKLSRYPRLSKAGMPLHYAPIVTTDSVPVSTNTATVYGNIVFNGWYDQLTAQGFQLSTTSDFSNATDYPFTPVNPYVECDQPCANNVFSVPISNLTPGATYYVRAYATNEAGTSYGEALNFVIENTGACPGTPTVTDHQGNVYTTVQIGYQCWTRQNMRCTTLPSGRTMTLGYIHGQGTQNATNSYVEPYYYDSSLSDTILQRGYLYNWAAAMDTVFSANSPDSYVKRRGICPKGWHVPSHDEWEIMLTYVKKHGNTDNYGCDGDSTKITKALSSNTETWHTTTTSCAPGNEPSMNNRTGFSTYPANYYAGSGVNVLHLAEAEYVRFWSSSSYDNSNAYYIGWNYYDPEVSSSRNIKSAGYSVRCLRDTTGLDVPSLTATVDNVTQETARVLSAVTADGGAKITERGICWSTDALPTINNYRMVDTTGEDIELGDYISQITTLTPNLTYHVRAYAINFEGVGYSEDVTITTPSPSNLCEGTPTVTDHEGNVYNTVKIGHQCWTRENMRCTTLPNGTPIGYGGNNNNNRRCYDTLKLYYSDTITAAPLEQRGFLYNWYAAMDTVSSTGNLPYMSFEKRRGICPEGWHIPSAAEWDTLNNYSNRQSEYQCRETSGSTKYIAKALASKYWWQPYQTYSNDSCYVGIRPDLNNASGMSIVPSGYYYQGSNRFENTNTIAYFWSSSLNSTTAYRSYNLSNSSMNNIGSSSSPRYEAIPVRCLRDTTGLYVPTLNAHVDTVTSTSVTVSGAVTADGGETVTAYGLCYSPDTVPTINDPKVVLGSGLESFTGQIVGLVPNTTYYVRAYATNYEGTGYSDVMEITTPAPTNACPGTPTVTDHENNVYNTVQIGNQCWTRENMRCVTTPKHPNDTLLNNCSGSNCKSYYEPHVYSPFGDDESLKTSYGYLYNWPAAMDTVGTQNITASFANRRGICPEGWHVPSKAEWDTLKAYVGRQAEYRCNNNSNNIGQALAAQSSWQSSNNNCYVGYDLTQNNATGFSAVATGYYSNGTSLNYSGQQAEFWSSTHYNGSSYSYYSHYYYLNNNGYDLGSGQSGNHSYGYSVRCIKNEQGAVESTIPTVSTTGVSEITPTSANWSGDVVSDGNATVTERGFCWNLEAHPDMTKNHFVCGDGQGAFDTVLNSLMPGYTYYFRAYAINELGVSYGEDISFTTGIDHHVDAIPYYSTFTDEEAWSLNNGSINRWKIGTNSYSSDNSLFVTDDNTNAHYNGQNYVDITAEKMLLMPSSDSVHVEFDLRAGGYGNSDYLKVFMVPSDYTSYTGSSEGTYAMDFSEYLSQTGNTGYKYKINLTNGNTLHISANIGNPAPNDTAKFVFFWHVASGSTNPTQPGAVISNLMIGSVGVQTGEVLERSSHTAKVSGTVQSLSGNPINVAERGFCWSAINNTPGFNNNHAAAGSGLGSFTGELTGLSPITTYYVRAYAICLGDTIYGSTVEFNTRFDQSTAFTLPYETQFADSAYWYLNNGTQTTYWKISVLNGESDTSLFVTNNGVDVKYDNNPTVVMAERYLVMPQTDSIAIEFDLNNLDGESTYDYLKVFLVPTDQEFAAQSDHNDYSTYNYSAMALCYNGKYYINDLSTATRIKGLIANPTPGDTAKLVFLWRNDGSTLNQPPACIKNLLVKVPGAGVRTGVVSDITSNHATVSGYLNIVAGDSFTECGICYGTTENPTMDGAHVTTPAGFTNGNFSLDLNNLEPSSLYYARAYLVKGGETIYSTQVSFITFGAFPYATDFSDHQVSWIDNSGEFGNSHHHWTVGTVEGQTALFVTQNGTVAGYNVGGEGTMIMVEKMIEMPSEATVNVAFDVKAGGESTCDYLKVFLVPEDVVFTPVAHHSQNDTATSWGYAYSNYAMHFIDYASRTRNTSNVDTNKCYFLNLTKGTMHVSEFMQNPDPNGKAKLVFMWVTDYSGGEQPGAIISNVTVSSIGIHSVDVVENTATSAVFHARIDNPNNKSFDACGVCYSSTTDCPTLTTGSVVTAPSGATGTFGVTMSNLTPGTHYYARAFLTENGVTTYDTAVPFNTAANIPYTTDFTDGSSWYMNNGVAQNKWMVGDYNNGKALYITTGTGATQTYSTGSKSLVMAEKLLALPAVNSVFVSFDVKSGGESHFDYLKVFLVPSETVFTPRTDQNTSDTATPYGYNYAVNAMDFSAYLSQTGEKTLPYKLNQTQENTLSVSESMANPVPNGGTAKLVFLWVNDNSGGDQPGAIITNVMVTETQPEQSFRCGTDKMVVPGGHSYETVKYGSQCWTKTNLREPAGTDHTSDKAYSNTAPYYYVRPNVNDSIYGYYYNWEAAKIACPEGWHLPSDAEWNVMESTLTDADVYPLDLRGDHSGKMAVGDEWGTSNVNGSPGHKTYELRNQSGFSARGVDRNYYGNFESGGWDAWFWTSSDRINNFSSSSTTYPLYHRLISGVTGVQRGTISSYSGLSVRCVQDMEITSETCPTLGTTYKNGDDVRTSVTVPAGVTVVGQYYTVKTAGSSPEMAEMGAELVNGNVVATLDLSHFGGSNVYISAHVIAVGCDEQMAVIDGAAISVTVPLPDVCPEFVSGSENATFNGTDIYAEVTVSPSDLSSAYWNSVYTYFNVTYRDGNNNELQTSLQGTSSSYGGTTRYYVSSSYFSGYTILNVEAEIYRNNCTGTTINIPVTTCPSFGPQGSHKLTDLGDDGVVVAIPFNNGNEYIQFDCDNMSSSDIPSYYQNDTVFFQIPSSYIDDKMSYSDRLNLLFSYQTSSNPCMGYYILEELNFRFTCGNTFVDRRGEYNEETYATVSIGNQCWMAENLRATLKPDGSDLVDEYYNPLFYYPDNNSDNVLTYGLLYTWNAMMNGEPSSTANPSTVQGICPNGWHVPSRAEWLELIDTATNMATCGNAIVLADNYDGWNSSGYYCSPGYDLSQNNASGFSARAAGYFENGIDGFGVNGNYWTGTEVSDNLSNAYRIRILNSAVNLTTEDTDDGGRSKENGHAVRCVKDVKTEAAETFSCGDNIQDNNGNTYATVAIGSQCWMKENLRTMMDANGSDLDENDFRYPGNDLDNLETYGLLYSWNAMMNGGQSSTANPSGVQGICPEGWHVPSLAEWNELIDTTNALYPNCAAKALAENLTVDDTYLWTYSSNDCVPGNDQDNNNSTGFSARPAGFSNSFGYDGFSYSAEFWSATQYSEFEVHYIEINYYETAVNGYIISKDDYRAVRCVRDANGSGTVSVNTCPGTPTVTDEEDNTYSTVLIGTQCWMAENLRSTRRGDYTVQTAYSPNNDPENVPTYGYLYTWNDAMAGQAGSDNNPSGVQGLCPDGWHVPSSDEWDDLLSFLNTNAQYHCNGIDQATAKALSSTSGWAGDSGDCTVGNDLSANNATGFSAYPAGRYSVELGIINFSFSTNFWGSSDYQDYAFTLGWYEDSSSLGEGYNSSKTSGFSVRCVKDL